MYFFVKMHIIEIFQQFFDNFDQFLPNFPCLIHNCLENVTFLNILLKFLESLNNNIDRMLILASNEF